MCPRLASSEPSPAKRCSSPTSILHGGPAPVRRFLPEMIDLIWNRQIDPGKVFDLTLPLEEVAEGYRAMDERRAIKSVLLPWVVTDSRPEDSRGLERAH